jgi:hypothetical protein
MKDRSIPVFLERRSYRQRRLMDFARLLPLLGILLWLVPLLWPQSDAGGTPPEGVGLSMSSAILYIFGVWAVLIFGALFVALLLGGAGDSQEDPDERND